MAQKKNAKGSVKKDSKPQSASKNGKKGEGSSGHSFFTWFIVLALLGVWTSVAVVWFDLVDYDDVLGKLGAYDADGDGDFDVEDAKVLLGLKEKLSAVVQDKVESQSPEELAEVEPEPEVVEEVIQPSHAEEAAHLPPDEEPERDEEPIEEEQAGAEEPEEIQDEPVVEEEWLSEEGDTADEAAEPLPESEEVFLHAEIIDSEDDDNDAPPYEDKNDDDIDTVGEIVEDAPPEETAEGESVPEESLHSDGAEEPAQAEDLHQDEPTET